MLVCLWNMQLTHNAHTHGFAPFLFPYVRYSLYSENSRDSLNVQQIYTGIIPHPPPPHLQSAILLAGTMNNKRVITAQGGASHLSEATASGKAHIHV